MTTLVVAELYPWPPVDGYRIRLDQVVRALAAAGPTDVLVLSRPGDPPPQPPAIDGVRRIEVLEAPAAAGPRDWLPAWVRGPAPRRLLAGYWEPHQDTIGAWVAQGGYDLVWCSHVDSWWPLARQLAGIPLIVDFDNLEHLALRGRRTAGPRFPESPSARQVAGTLGRWALSRAFDLVDERRWCRVQRAASAAARHVVVCSELDVARSECPNAVCIPNGAERRHRVRSDRRTLAGDGPVFGFVGLLSYEPNADAVRWFVESVWPTIHAARPDARFRVVGRGGAGLAELGSVPGVVIVGEVEDLAEELWRTDVSVVPIRFGAGTRLKVLEAMAHRIPVVSTTVGCEGIGLVDGVDVLLADEAGAFAAACLRLAGEGEQRHALADAAEARFDAGFDWVTIRARIAELARSARRSDRA